MRRCSSRVGRPALAAAFAIGCATSPPAPEVPSWHRGNEGLRVEDSERALWDEAREAVAEIEADDDFVANTTFDAYLAQVLGSLALELDDRAPKLRARVVKGARRGAAALPNGVILLSSSLLADLANEAELAAVLGHEAAHVVLRHSLVANRYAGVTHVDVTDISQDQADEIKGKLSEHGLTISGLGYYPNALVADHEEAHHAALRLATVWRDAGKFQQAADLIVPIHDWFTEGFDTPDLKDAKALLDELD